MFSSIWHACKSIFNRVKNSIKKWTKPVTVTLAAGAVADLTRKRQDLLVENAILTRLGGMHKRIFIELGLK